MITLPELPYKRDGLAPHITEETLNYHYGKHHKGYVDNLNKLIKGTDYEDMDLEKIIEKSSGTIFNNAAQVWNHTFYWNSLTDEPKDLDGDSKLAKAIDKKFGGVDDFKDAFKEKATKIFGSGWCWLVRDGESVAIETTTNANRPDKPLLLVCDVWEHAYYLDYQNDRGKYVDAFFKIINWEFASKNMETP